MKILHTADWHAGRTLHGVDRTPEIREVLREIAALAVEEQVDLILVAGDLYDSKRPGPDAEAAVYEFFLTTGQAGIPSVVIAGNHDHPDRLEAAGGLLKLANVHAFGQVRVAGQGGAFQLQVGDEMAQVAALPFISERRIVKVAELLEADPGQWRERYQEGMRKLVANLTEPFSSDTVNLLLMHTTMTGASLANSEYEFHCTEAYSLNSDIFPESCNYLALGHIHKPQAIQGYPEHAGRYSGSILQLDFGEQADKKYVYIIEAEAGKPTKLLKEHAIEAGKRLVRHKLEPDTLERRLLDLADHDGWLKLSIKLDAPRPGLKDRIKAELPNVLVVEMELPGEEQQPREGVDLERITLTEAYAQYYVDRKGQDVSDPLQAAFNELYELSHGEAEETAAATSEEDRP